MKFCRGQRFHSFVEVVGRALTLALAVVLLACQPYQSQKSINLGLGVDEDPPLCQAKPLAPKALYGPDDRKDLWEVEGPLKEYWASATLALVEKSSLEMRPDGFVLKGPRHGPSKNLCDGAPFVDQPEIAFCSGFLVAENLIVTAGHCIRNNNECRRTQFVFDFGKTNPLQDEYRVPSESVYGCRKVVNRQLFLSDFALIELDRKVEDRTPLNIRREGSAQVGDDVILIGHPSGLPTKIATGGKVLESGRQIYASVDAFKGNSGSLVFNKSLGLVEGILVAGEPDYILNGTCKDEYRCDEKCEGEIITPIGDLAEDIPNKIYEAPETLCLD